MIAKNDSTFHYPGADINIGLSSLSMREDNHLLERICIKFYRWVLFYRLKLITQIMPLK
jgi:hypothetical protein